MSLRSSLHDTDVIYCWTSWNVVRTWVEIDLPKAVLDEGKYC